MAIEMTDDEIDEFLDRRDKLYLGTVSENGWPHVVPLGFARLDDPTVLYVRTGPDDRKSLNIYRENRVCLLIEDGVAYDELRGVFVHAYGTVVRDTDTLAELERAYTDQHFGGEVPEILRRLYDESSARVWFRFEPAHVTTWDNTKIETERLPDPTPQEEIRYQYGPDDAGTAEPDAE